MKKYYIVTILILLIANLYYIYENDNYLDYIVELEDDKMVLEEKVQDLQEELKDVNSNYEELSKEQERCLELL